MGVPRARRVRGRLTGQDLPANGYGLYDVVGNVWEWTADWFTPQHTSDTEKACCVPHNPRVTSRDSSFAPGQTTPYTRVE